MPADAPPAPRPAGGVLAPPVLAGAARLLAATWRVRFVDREIFDAAVSGGGAVLAFWHGEQLPLALVHRGLGLGGLASLSRDGELLTRVIARLGYRPVRGSTSRGGARALRRLVRLVRDEGLSPGIAVDGPRGPRHEPRAGALALAAWTGRPVVYVLARARPALALRSWDRFLVPLPGARVLVGYGRMDPPAPGRAALEAARAELRRRMLALGERLDAALSGRGPAP